MISIEKEFFLLKTISNEVISIWLYLKAKGLQDFSLNTIRKDLGFKLKDIDNLKRNRDCVVDALVVLKRFKMLTFYYEKDILHIDWIKDNQECFLYPKELFLSDRLNPTEKRFIVGLFIIDCTRRKKYVCDLCGINGRNGIRVIKSLIGKGLIKEKTPKLFTWKIRSLWRKGNPINETKSVINI